MLIKPKADLTDHDVTDHKLYLSRRKFIQQAGLVVAASSLGWQPLSSANTPGKGRKLSAPKSERFVVNEAQTPYQDVTSYNNFYEFGTDKTDPARYAREFQTRPWVVQVEGAVEKPQNFNIEDLLSKAPLEERVYRLRCVEAWSMVIPWIGFELSWLLKQVKPLNNAKFVEFTTLNDPKQMPGQRQAVLAWPYVEGLRMDEAMHPLSLLAVGLYGEVLPNQNGAPLRLVVPWKYGFKSIKSIVKIRLVEQAPRTTWMRAGPSEYGFYSNVNPEVDHARWSQRRERRIGDFLKRNTLMFNGYTDQVASLYTGMDLKQNF